MENTNPQNTDVMAILQQRLAPSGGGKSVKIEYVQLARGCSPALASDSTLVPGTVCKDAGIKSGGTITRITEYRNRIVNERLLAECASVQALPDPDTIVGCTAESEEGKAAPRPARALGRAARRPRRYDRSA